MTSLTCYTQVTTQLDHVVVEEIFSSGQFKFAAVRTTVTV